MSYLHVLNGDAVLTAFNQSSLPGDIVVCREVLCEGKVKNTKDPDVFFESRAKHLEFHYGIDKQSYYTQVVQELEKIKPSGSLQEIILWFDNDLFCQFNLLFMIHLIRQRFKALPLITLVDLPRHPTPENYATLFETRTTLTETDLEIADDIWDALCLDTPQALELFSHMNNGHFKHMATAITAHLSRFPNTENGLSSIQEFFLQRLQMGDYRWYDLYKLFWDSLPVYGFGDFQLDVMTNRMIKAGVLEQDDQMLRITSLGSEILANEENYMDYAPMEHRWLGGVRLKTSRWRWNKKLQRLVSM
ncbi:DUF1835 domain-containing protein [Chitinophaga sp. Cy-1792]|uniref:DUF1835 domain-containing protein n=1 Tax=Chitinophaga sp. Cy-1792 TaxID=2608339 RepID=UPI00142188C1|nr:DUF1835 domain-containing protein [Chitinophaga sp. Cy-1792]NIG51853.1 DUF1835 domain-containing protein [Chitinophaga sp. Cy-1792]